MSKEVPNREAAIARLEEYAESECVGRLGDVTDVEEHDSEWHIKFETHTFSDRHRHRIRITKSVGNVISHERASRFD